MNALTKSCAIDARAGVNALCCTETLEAPSIKLAIPSDVPELISLSESFSLANLGDDISFGYLLRLPNPDGWTRLIVQNNVVIAKVGGRLVGFYSVDHYDVMAASSEKSILAERRYNVLMNIGLRDKYVSFGAQNCVDKNFQGQGIRPLMLKYLKNYISNKYEYLFSVIMKNNYKSIKANGRDGWSIADCDEYSNYVLLKIK